MSIWLIGAGPMAALHAKVLQAMDVAPVTIIATSATRAKPLAAAHDMAFFANGLEQAIADLPTPDAAVIALPVDKLADAAHKLVLAGVKKVLVEKPGCLTAAELAPVVEAAEANGSFVAIAYNRRFFASVIEARKRIDTAGEILSMNFEFCEDAPRIEALPTPASIKDKWVLANSSHVIDLAFHLCGFPDTMINTVTGQLPWHPAGADFRGTGITQTGAQFSYYADWRGPGRWGMEIVLPHERLILRPMEELAIMPRGSFQSEVVEIDNQIDRDFKPGLYRQTEALLAQIPGRELVTARQQLDAIKNVYAPIANYEMEP